LDPCRCKVRLGSCLATLEADLLGYCSVLGIFHRWTRCHYDSPHYIIYGFDAGKSDYELVHPRLVGSQVRRLPGRPSYTHFSFLNSTWRRPNSFYQILYGCLGTAQAINTFLLCVNWSHPFVELAINHFHSGASMDLMGYFVSQNLHFRSVKRVLYAPMSFFDTTVSLVMYAALGGH